VVAHGVASVLPRLAWKDAQRRSVRRHCAQADRSFESPANMRMK
jgi:hypothetical protein